MKNKLGWFLLFSLLLTLGALAQDAPPAVPIDPAPEISPGVADAISKFLVPLVAKYPVLATIIAVLGTCRLLLKPTFTWLHSVVQATPTTKDDEWLQKAESSAWFRWLSYGLDYVASIKLIHPKATATVASTPAPAK